MKTNTPLILSAPKGGHLAYLAGDGIFGQPVYTVTWDPEGQGLLFFADSG